MPTFPVSSLDPFADDFLAAPYPFYEELREAGPVVWLERYGLWACVKKFSNASPLPKRQHSSLSASRTENTCHIRLLDGKKVFLKDQVLEAPNVEGRPYVSR